jgi:hypothetical protein
MIHEFTRSQLDALTIDPNRPLVICDVDDVVVHFLRGFDRLLADIDHVLEANSFALNGNVVHTKTRAQMPQPQVSELVDQYFIDQTAHMEAIDGAAEALHAFSKQASVVMLTNLPHHARDNRILNLKGHGLSFPVITNSGPKGPAILDLASRTTNKTVFIDDSPSFIQSSYDSAPNVHLVHFLHDQRFAVLHEPFHFVGLTTSHWDEIKAHVTALLATPSL